MRAAYSVRAFVGGLVRSCVLRRVRGRGKVGRVRNWQASVRGILIALALLFGGLSGVPDAAPRYLQSFPFVVRRARELFDSARAVILGPVNFIPELFQFSEQWKLFSSANDARFWMWIEARQGNGDTWQLLYRPHDPEHTFMGSVLEYRRVRGNWNPSRRGANRGYDGFATWVARRVFAQYPQYRVVRIRMEEIRLMPLGMGFAPTGKFLHTRTRERREVPPL
jgi:hypothetical protein